MFVCLPDHYINEGFDKIMIPLDGIWMETLSRDGPEGRKIVLLYIIIISNLTSCCGLYVNVAMSSVFLQRESSCELNRAALI